MDPSNQDPAGLCPIVCTGDGGSYGTDPAGWKLYDDDSRCGDYGRDALPLLEKCQVVYTPIREDPFSAEKMREFEEYLSASGNSGVAEKIQKIHVPMVTGGRRMEHFPQELLWGYG